MCLPSLNCHNPIQEKYLTESLFTRDMGPFVTRTKFEGPEAAGVLISSALWVKLTILTNLRAIKDEVLWFVKCISSFMVLLLKHKRSIKVT